MFLSRERSNISFYLVLPEEMEEDKVFLVLLLDLLESSVEEEKLFPNTKHRAEVSPSLTKILSKEGIGR